MSAFQDRSVPMLSKDENGTCCTASQTGTIERVYGDQSERIRHSKRGRCQGMDIKAGLNWIGYGLSLCLVYDS